MLSQASGLSLAVSLRSWNWRMLSEPTAPKSLTGTYLLTLMNADRFQITVNRDVGTMTDQHVPHATITEDGTHLTIVDAASHTTRLALNIDTLIVERYALQTFYIILTEMTHHHGNCR